jgi:hypothetical protein
MQEKRFASLIITNFLEIELKYKGECLEFIIQTFPYLFENQAVSH